MLAFDAKTTDCYRIKLIESLYEATKQRRKWNLTLRSITSPGPSIFHILDLVRMSVPKYITRYLFLFFCLGIGFFNIEECLVFLCFKPQSRVYCWIHQAKGKYLKSATLKILNHFGLKKNPLDLWWVPDSFIFNSFIFDSEWDSASGFNLWLSASPAWHLDCKRAMLFSCEGKNKWY